MIVSIMQPYLFPYIGYFQLIAHSDLFVLYDDAQYMKGGWINRNRILLDGRPHWLTVPVDHAPVRTPINARAYRLPATEASRLSALMAAAYRRAPHVAATLELFGSCLCHTDHNVARFNAHSLRQTCGRLGVGTPMVASSSLGRDLSLAGDQAVIDICRRVGANAYLNPVGGSSLYSQDRFSPHGLELKFLRSIDLAYPQAADGFQPRLSILDVMMSCDADAVAGLLASCEVAAADAQGEGVRP